MAISRRDFLAVAGMLGVGGLAAACSDGSGSAGNGIDETASRNDEDETAPHNEERVMIVGAGAAGMATAHLLTQRGVDVTILEAAPTHGGRIKRSTDFVDVPLPLGGEWLPVEEATLARIVTDDTIEVTNRWQVMTPRNLPVRSSTGSSTSRPARGPNSNSSARPG